MDAKAFFDFVRRELGALNQGQVDGLTLFLDEAARRGTGRESLAYILATAWWETGRTMQPVREAFYIGANAEAWRKKNLRYYPWYGRGYVQLTWERNYRLAAKKLGVDFIARPDDVMIPRHAVRIAFEGMEEGWFTGKALDDCIDDIDEGDAEDLREYTAARRIINGTDKAATIGKLALAFENALRAAGYTATGAAGKPAKPAPVPPAPSGPDEAERQPAPAPDGGMNGLAIGFVVFAVLVAILIAVMIFRG